MACDCKNVVSTTRSKLINGQKFIIKYAISCLRNHLPLFNITADGDHCYGTSGNSFGPSDVLPATTKYFMYITVLHVCSDQHVKIADTSWVSLD